MKYYSLLLVAILAVCTGFSQTADQVKPALLSDEAFNAVAEFFQYEKSFDLNARVISRTDSTRYVREKISFDGGKGSRVVGYFAYPKTKLQKYPVVLLVDGITGSKERWFQWDSWPRGGEMTAALIERGFAVLTLDAPSHGERSHENDFAGIQDLFRNKAWSRDLVVNETIEYMRAVDYICGRSDVDSNRIGVMGHSLGGLISFNLAALDRRIKVAVPAVTPLMTISPAIYVGNFAKRARDIPILVLMGDKDWVYSIADAKQFYSGIPVKTKKMILYDAGHRLPPEYVKDAAEWISQYLK
jgi:cephalosporin-C deacetylase-like acetyl esterase